MAAVEIFFHRVLTDDRWMNQAACKGLTHLFFPPPAERPQARDRREAAAKSVCASCIVHSSCQEYARIEPRVRVLGWRERGRTPLRRLPLDRPDRRASPQRRLTTAYDRRMSGADAHIARPSTRRGRPTAIRARLSASMRSAPTSRRTASTDCISTTARRLVSKVSSYGSYFLFVEDHEQLDRCARYLGSTRFTGMLADIWSRTVALHLVRPAHVGRVLRRRTTSRVAAASLSIDQIANLATEIAEFHLACTDIAPLLPSASKTIKSDAIHLLDLLESPFATAQLRPPAGSNRACCGSTPIDFSNDL